MQKEWLVADEKTAVSPVRAEMDCFGYFDNFWPIQAAFVVGGALCDLETPS